jgi:hypothetical protein
LNEVMRTCPSPCRFLVHHHQPPEPLRRRTRPGTRSLSAGLYDPRDAASGRAAYLDRLEAFPGVFLRPCRIVFIEAGCHGTSISPVLAILPERANTLDPGLTGCPAEGTTRAPGHDPGTLARSPRCLSRGLAEEPSQPGRGLGRRHSPLPLDAVDQRCLLAHTNARRPSYLNTEVDPLSKILAPRIPCSSAC